MKINPEDHNIPGDFRHWHGDKAEDFLGPFFFRLEGEVLHTAFRVEERHCNAHDSLHGGIMMAFADYTLCLAANGGAEESVATVTCNNEFVAPAFKGELVLGRSELVRRGRSLVFARGDLRVDDRIILTSSGVIKLLKKR
ncbi:MAG: PaaI family thioesterase [Gammaproteobacteria bacterium]|nr:PaaI family thioesterase [Gammaproteobacteria bacterium]